MSILPYNITGNNFLHGPIPSLLGQDNYDKIPTDPEVCRLFEKLNVEWLLRAIAKSVYPMSALQTLSLRKLIYYDII